jgi:hypothetical protein
VVEFFGFPLETPSATPPVLLDSTHTTAPVSDIIGCRRVPARLQDGVRGDRLKAVRLALSIRAFAGLDQEQEPGSACGET